MNPLCRHCGKSFEPFRSVSHQAYCSSRDCQKARKRNWQKQKLEQDPDYSYNQKSSQKGWRERHPDYMREYRLRSPSYVKENRLQQQQRNACRKKRKFSELPATPSSSLIVKMDELKPELQRLLFAFPFNVFDLDLIVKMDELNLYRQKVFQYLSLPFFSGVDCKEMTSSPKHLSLFKL